MSAVPGGHEVDLEVGRRIRGLRLAAGLSLKTVSERTGMSIGFLSQIERGLSSPSLRVLAGLSDVLGVGLAGLFRTAADDEQGTFVVRRAERGKLQLWRSGITKQLLTPMSAEARLNVFLVEMQAGADTGEEPYSHDGEEAGLVLSGAMTLTVDGVSHRLAEGDSFRFESRRPHRFANASDGVTRVVWVNALPG